MAQAEQGRRRIVQDPLRQTATQALPERSVPLQGVRGPAAPSMRGFAQERSDMETAFSALDTAVQGVFERQKDEWITNGKMAYMTGVTEAELMKSGNRFTQMGYLQLKTKNDVDEWVMQQQVGLQDAAATMSPEQYQEHLKQTRADYLGGLTDPYAKRVAVAAFEQHFPSLAQKQMLANNEHNRIQRENEFARSLDGGSMANTDASVVDVNTELRLHDTAVSPVMQMSATDRDVAIRTLIGEAGNQSEFGMAAVAHVIFNRTTDSRYPNSVGGVVKQAGQFSIWKPGVADKNARNIRNLSTSSKLYQKAAAVVDAVASGRHLDPTGGATHYYSPKGMEAYKAKGLQSHLVPGWASKTEAENLVIIGAHRFSGKTNGAHSVAPRQMQEAMPGIDEWPRGDEQLARMPGIDESPNLQHGVGAEDLPGNKLFNGKVNQTIEENVAEVEGVTGVTEPGQPTQLRDQILNDTSVKDPVRRASIVADRMISQLLTGNDQLYNDAGGTSVLHELGAPMDVIDKVNAAHAKFIKKKNSEFDEADVIFQDELMKDIGAGKIDRDEALKRIRERRDAQELSDAQATSLATSATTALRSKAASDQKEADKWNSAANNPQFLMEAGRLYQLINTGEIGTKEAFERAGEIALEYNLEAAEVEKLLGQIQSLDQAHKNRQTTAAASLANDVQKSNEVKADVDKALATGVGLGDVSGKVRVVAEDGTVTKMSAKEYGIELLREKALGNNPDDPVGTLRDFLGSLQQHGVVDPTTRAQLRGATSGPLIMKENGKHVVRQDALQSYDVYTMLRQDPTITDAYVGQLIGDPYTRSVLELAYQLDAGNLSGPDALIRAKEAIDSKDDSVPVKPLTKTPQYNQLVQDTAEKLLSDGTEPGWIDWMLGTHDPGEADTALQFGMPEVKWRLNNLAEGYNQLYPMMTPEAKIALAQQDLQKSMQVVAGNVVFADGGLHVKMGLTDKSTANAAVKAYIEAGAPDWWKDINDNWWQDVWADSPEKDAYGTRSAGQALADAGGVALDTVTTGPLRAFNQARYKSPPVHIKWLPNTGPQGSFVISRVLDLDTGQLDVARQKVVPAEVVGEFYKEREAEPSVIESIYNAGRRAAGSVVRDVRDDQAETGRTEYSTKTRQIPPLGAQ